MRRAAIALAALLVGACNSDVDEAWELDHDRLIAVRAEPPGIAPGETSVIDGLLGVAGGDPREVAAERAEVLSPLSLASALVGTTVTAPSEEQLAAARAELGLAAGESVPLQMRVWFAGTEKVGLKIVQLGARVENPVIASALLDGEEIIGAASLVVPREADVRLDVDFPVPNRVNWLTSCGTMHDFDLANAYLRVEPEDPQQGLLGLVVRDESAGVAWTFWPIAAE